MSKSKKIIILVAALVVLVGVGLTLLFIFLPKGEDTGARDIYTIANESNATSVTTQIDFTTAEGESLDGWFAMQSEGNNAIIDYEFSWLQTVEEAAENGLGRIVTEEGKYYYIDGIYYKSGEGTPWIGAPDETEYKFELDQTKLINPTVSQDGKTLVATMTPTNCVEMFGFDINAKGDLVLVIETNGTNLTRLEISCTTVSDAKVYIRNSYSYNTELNLDFSEIIGEPEEE